MEKEKKKINFKIIIPIVAVVIVAVVGVIAVMGNKNNKTTAETETDTSKQKYYSIGETATNEQYEFTLEKLEFVNSIYETSFSNISENDIIKQKFSPVPKTQASEDNTIIAVKFKIKNISKESQSNMFTFGLIDYNNGYQFDSMSSQGATMKEVNLIRYNNNNIYKQYTFSTTQLQPLSEAVTLEAFFEVPKELKENQNTQLIYKNLGFEFKIR